MPLYRFTHCFVGDDIKRLREVPIDEFEGGADLPEGTVAFTSYEFIGTRYAQFVLSQTPMARAYEALTKARHTVLCIGECVNGRFVNLDTPAHHGLTE